MSEKNINMIGFLVALINEFAKRFDITDKESYEYIARYGGIEMFIEHYNILHTLSFADMVEGMASFCHRKGGELTL